MKNSLPIRGHIKLRHRLKSLASGQAAQQRRAENTLRRSETGLAKAVAKSKNAFIDACAAAYTNHHERDFHTELLTRRIEVKVLLAQQEGRSSRNSDRTH